MDFFNMKMQKQFLFFSSFLFLIAISAVGQEVLNNDLGWKEGYLDIHFIHSGRGNSSFLIFPDGTSLLYDVGEARQNDRKAFYPPFSDEEKTPPDRVIKYLNFFNPNDSIDYAVVSHFHSDHYGQILAHTPFSKKGDYRLTGITAVGDSIPFKHLLDRAYPHYNYPRNLRASKGGKENKTLVNYLKFIIDKQQNKGLKVSQVKVGSNRQIKLNYKANDYPTFEVRNIKSNDHLWTGVADEVGKYPFDPPLVNETEFFNENPLSIALKVRYGKFDYFVGGDLPGINDHPDYDIETPIANIIGEVDALTLNHHGYKDASNLYFLQKLSPQVIAHQSLHDPHFSENVQQNLFNSDADVFSLFMSKEVKNYYKKEIRKSYKSTQGHFFIRIYPQGENFDVFVLNESSEGYTLKEKFGPYKSR